VKSFFLNLTGILLAALLFAVSFPNPLVPLGLPFLAWIAYIPLFVVIGRSGMGASVLWGALYGYISYSLFSSWLGAFHPMAGIIASVLQLFYMALLFLLLKLARILYPEKGYLLQWLLWLAYEYLRTLGFLGFPYGITGYTQWQFLPLIQIASIFGVWGVSALVLFPSVYLAGALEKSGNANSIGNLFKPRVLRFFRRECIPAFVWVLALIAALVYGFVSPADYAGEASAKITLIQQNADPWKEDNPRYHRRMLAMLTDLSRKALAAENGADLVVWPETAFVPRIFWHINYRDDPESYALVKELMDFLAKEETPYLIGNDDGRQELDVSGRWERVDYNGALLFDGAELKQGYRKLHLVPFTEYFPFGERFPRFYRTLLAADTHFWKPGAEETVFTTGKLRFSAPICFEDTFGYLSRNFTRRGAELIVNISNDAWAGSLACQMQHLSMAVFRAVENRRSLVRATASGQTCAVDPNGKILAMAQPFTGTFLNVQVPLMTKQTLYTRWGDLWGILFSAAAVVVLLLGTIKAIMRLIKTGRGL
jgi:apolipoprotein N-acyltransferase